MTMTADIFAARLAHRLGIMPSADDTPGLQFRGHQDDIQRDTSTELVLCGPAGTGKSVAALYKLHRAMLRYPGARGLIVRKVRADIGDSALVTFETHIADEDLTGNVQRTYRRVYRYKNGSEIVIAGMDRPKRVMSAEYDLIYVQEAVELREEDWEALITRLRNGKMPYQQLLADTNPDAPDHWLKLRADRGQARMLYTNHADNPAYFDGNDWTAVGRSYLEKLNALTGIRRARYLDGRWVRAEGAIYDEWQDGIHVIDRFKIPADWRRFVSLDFGYTNPFVALWFAQDHDGRLYIYRELYKTRRLVQDHALDIVRLSAGETIEFFVADHDAEGRATLEAAGIYTYAARKEVLEGIQAVQARFRVRDDGRPGLMYLRESLVERDADLDEAKRPTSLIAEVGGYVWANKTNKETPVKENDHALDALRYGVMAIDSGMNTYIMDVG